MRRARRGARADGVPVAPAVAANPAATLYQSPLQLTSRGTVSMVFWDNLMAASDVNALQRSDLNKFLFADVGTEASGMVLSVVSLLARQGSDPWREADRLAVLPKADAADSLAHAIANMPHGPWNLQDAVAIAARLIGLLPARPARADRSSRHQQSSHVNSPGDAAAWRLPSWLPAWIPSRGNAIVLAIVVLGVAFAVTAMVRPSPEGFEGSDVTSFVAPRPAAAVPGNAAAASAATHATPPALNAPDAHAADVPAPGVAAPRL